jgi:hypothetical protein
MVATLPLCWRYISFTAIDYSIVLSSCWHQHHKRFYPDWIASSGHRIRVHPQFEISVLLGAPSTIQIHENQWRLNQDCRAGGFMSSHPIIAYVVSVEIFLRRQELPRRRMLFLHSFPGLSSYSLGVFGRTERTHSLKLFSTASYVKT